MASLKSLHQYTGIRKLSVFGFLREKSKQLSIPHIPTIINYLCVAYYEPNYDFFDTGPDREITLSVDQGTATLFDSIFGRWYVNYAPVTVYGYHWIDSLSKRKHEWKFKINRKRGKIAIGVSSKDDALNGEEEFGARYANPISYGLQIIDSSYYQFNQNDFRKVFSQKTDNISLIVLTLQNGRLSYSMNTFDQTLYEFRGFDIETGTDVKYKMGVTLRSTNDSITLQNYKISS